MTPQDAAQLIGPVLLALGKGNFSRHLDEILEADQDYPGLWSLEMYLALLKFMKSARESRTLVLVIPVSVTDALKIDRDIAINGVAYALTPPTIVLFDGDYFFAPAHEEFRMRLLPPEIPSDVRIAYRSWRSVEDAQQGWEFTNDIYIWNESRVALPVR